MSNATSSHEGKPSSKKTNWGLGAALGAAVAASACCTIPLALVSLGVGGAWISGLAALEPYRWLFVSLAAGALGYAGWHEWQMSRRPDCDCETVFSSRARRTLLGAGAIAVVALTLSPWLLAASPSAATGEARAAAAETSPNAPAHKSPAPATFQQVVLSVEGMTCSTCPITVRKALERAPGVYSAEATFEPPEAVVRFDPGRTSVQALTQATADAGFPSEPTSSR